MENFTTAGRVTLGTREELVGSYASDTEVVTRFYRAPLETAKIVSSELHETGNRPAGMHMPALDIDLPVRVVPSSTEGHYHLYIDKEMSWRKYRRLLRALKRAGIIEPGYYDMSVRRKATHLRVPHYRKTS